jgi:hypothetical protein
MNWMIPALRKVQNAMFDLKANAIQVTLLLANNKRRTIKAIPRNPFQSHDFRGSQQVNAVHYQLTCQDADIVGLERGDSVLVDCEEFRVEQAERVGTGITRLHLDKVTHVVEGNYYDE